MESRLAITWGLSRIHGWGVFGINLVHELLRRRGSWPAPMLLQETPESLLSPEDLKKFRALIDERESLIAATQNMERATLQDVCVLHSSGNKLLFGEMSKRFSGSRNFGFTFFENTDFIDESVALAKTYDGMFTGSNWNRDVLLELGMKRVVCVHQGVDTETFHPRPPTGRLAGRFVVFSGGKLEFRKGQDIVIAAFRIFQKRHPEALLLTIWQNQWPASIPTLADSPHVQSYPDDCEPTTLAAWTQREGIPEGAHVDLGPVANHSLPEVYREADVALFPNRCEGGTNLVAMETMAAGVPTILSANTGHLDIMTESNCYALSRQTPVADPAGTRRGWGESDVDEILEALEAVHADRNAAKKRGLNGARRMFKMGWPNQIALLMDELAKGA